MVEALARAGIFRLRAVLVGTVAYQCYSAMLGARLPGQTLHTADIDIAQFSAVSIAVEDQIPSILGVLSALDPSFRAVPSLHDNRRVTSYETKSGVRVDFLTPNRGPDSDAPAALPALGTGAQQLRFLDFLIRDPVSAVLLHGSGVYVTVPAPERYAVHKLIVARRRRAGDAKQSKDLRQAEALFVTLCDKRPHELRAAWEEAAGRGKTWRTLLGEGLGALPGGVRDETLRVVGQSRSTVPDLDLRFSDPPGRYDIDSDVVTFIGDAGADRIRCSISRSALDDHFGADGLNNEGLLRRFRENRPRIEAMARIKYLSWPVEEVGAVLIKTNDVERLSV